MIVAVAAALVGLTVLWVLSPLFGWGGGEEAFDAEAREREDLLAQRREVLSSIKDLEMEYRLGKLTAEDFEETRERLAGEAVGVLRRLDERAAAPRGDALAGSGAEPPDPGAGGPRHAR